MLDFGNKNRTQHPTDANAESSRSHAVFQVFLRYFSLIVFNLCVASFSYIKPKILKKINLFQKMYLEILKS